MPPPPSPLSAFSLLPALSIVLGLPLCHGTHGGVVVGSPSTSADEPSADVDVDVSSSTPKSRHLLHQQSEGQVNPDLAERAKNNASRIYARRVINRARLERQHPWNDDASVQPEKLNQTSSSSWKDELLSETLLSIIKLKEQITKAKSITNGGISDERFDFMDNFLSQNTKLLSQLGVNKQTNSHSNNLLFSLINNNNVAYCETNFREEYLSATASATAPSSSSSGDNSFKPAEWSDDIDLVQRRLEFGQEISPLSNTTRLQRWGMATKRILTLGMLVAPLGVMVPCNLVLGNFTGKSSSKEQEEEKNPSALQNYHLSLTKRTWDYALWAIETAGPTYIKLVQWASTRNDLFSPEFVGHFSKLQDETRGHTWRETEATLVRAYGKDWRNVLSFDKVIDDDDDESDGEEGGRLKRKGGTANRERQKRLERNETKSNNTNASGGSSSAPQPTIPIGSGCVAQVYKARLRSSYGLHPAGTSVAVKVQHPNILEKVCLDFYLMNKAASFLERIPYLNLDYLSIKDSVDQFRDIMLPQLDLRVEAHNLQRFRRDFEGESQIAFPEPLVNLTSREVLVERFVEGEPMLNFVLKEDDQHSKKDREELATIGLETVMKMIFLHDFVHADLVSLVIIIACVVRS